MAYFVTDACINCGACEDGCPVEAIKPANDKHEINQDICVQCGACAGTCPVDAIKEGVF